MTDQDVNNYAKYLSTMTEPQLSAEADTVCDQSSRGADVSIMMTLLVKEYDIRKDQDGFIKHYNLAVGGTK